MTDSYYTLKSRNQTDGGVIAYYQSNKHAQGAWNPHEQHMAPATGVLCAELETFMSRDDMRIARISLDILGLIHFGEFCIHTKLIRAGRTIELIEAVMIACDKVCIVARAWRLQISDTTAIAGLENQDIVAPDTLPDWDGLSHWGGGYIQSIRAKADLSNRQGRGVVWINTDLPMIYHNNDALPTSDFVRIMGMVDVANGIVPRIHQPDGIRWIFPNIDLQIHLLRLPIGSWLGLETMQQIGNDGVGLTSSVLHDKQGVFGHSEQILTVRKL
ncbi:thioesterase family protein [Moraxella nasovis]|uniref:thioesterase family protein n=1 Tax=Moraxella nasovis TaxID=2904121 RepID=UPI001F60BFC8|nr:thioesterase family protein [Moraxella nasovis]UNU74039.1 thioesterase family protein [Moraxella nasovis]